MTMFKIGIKHHHYIIRMLPKRFPNSHTYIFFFFFYQMLVRHSTEFELAPSRTHAILMGGEHFQDLMVNLININNNSV